MNKKMMPIVVIVIMAIFFFELYMIFKINSEEKNPPVHNEVAPDSTHGHYNALPPHIYHSSSHH